MKVTRVKLKFVDSSRRIYDPPATEGLAWLSVYPTIKRSQRRLSGKINCSCSKEQILNRNFYSPRKAENFLINNNFGRLCFSRLIIKIHCIAIISREGLPKMSDWDKGSSLGQLQFKTWRKPIHMTYRIHQLISAHPTPTSVWSKTKRGCPPRPLPWVRHWSPNSPSLWVMRQKQCWRRLISNRTLTITAQIRTLYSISCSYTDLNAYYIECCIKRICTYRSPIGLFSLSPTCICHLHIFHNTPSPCLRSQILHKLCLQFLLGRPIPRGN